MRECMYVQVRVDEKILNAFRESVSLRRGDLSREFNKALYLYLGALENILVVRRCSHGPLQITELINPVYELFDFDCESLTCETVPLFGSRFNDVTLRKLVEQLMHYGVTECCENWPDVPGSAGEVAEEVIEKIRNGHRIEFKVAADCELCIEIDESRVKFEVC